MPIGRNAFDSCGFTFRATVYTRVSSCGSSGGADHVFLAGNPRVAGKEKSQRVVGRFGDADAGSDLNISCAKAIFADP